MKDFDAARAERPAMETEEEFILGGETFAIRAASTVRPDAITAAMRITQESAINEDLANLDEVILGFLKDEDNRARFRELRKREDEPVTFADLFAVQNWIIEVAAGRPTEQPSSSITGPGPTGASLTAVSDSPPAAQAG